MAKKGQFTAGNRFWELRSQHGRAKLFASPQLLWDAACEYFQWCIENPIEDPRSFGKMKIQRPYTMHGLCRYLDCNTAYFRQFKENLNSKGEENVKEGEDGFSTVITRIEETVYQQKFENAVIGVYKDNIIARDLGLSDKRDLNHKLPTQITISEDDGCEPIAD